MEEYFMNLSNLHVTETIQCGVASVIVWGVLRIPDASRDDSDRYVSIPSDHIHPFVSIVDSDKFW